MSSKKSKELLDSLKEITEQLELVAKNQKKLKKELQMIFSDITHFENMVIKILDNYNTDFPKEKYHHWE